MKVIREKDDNPWVAVTLRLPKELLDQVTAVAEKHDISRQRLVAAILEQVLHDKDFELKIRD